MKRPAPTSPRETFEALARYDKDEGLEVWLDGFDFTAVTPHQVYYSVLGRLPENARVAAMPPGYDARRHYTEVLHSEEFQKNLIAHVLRAFPEKTRLFFVHVPKCAGSDLGSHLMQRHGDAYLGQMDQNPVHLLPSLLPWRLQIIMSGIAQRDTLAVVGHIGLNWLLGERLLRHGDTVFSVVRDPIDMAVSKVNYTLTLLARDGGQRVPPILDWIDKLKLHAHADGLPQDPAALQALARQLLRDEKVTPRNNLCRFLGRGDAQSALDLCASANIELTTVSRYDRWLSARWGIPASQRINESHRFLHREALSAGDMDYLRDLTAEDRVFHDRIESRLVASGQLSIFGASL